MIGEKGRTEGRAQKLVALQLAQSGPGAVPEICFTENVSPHGLRISTHRFCHPRDQLAIFSLSGRFRSQAEVIYCQPKAEGNSYIVGLKLIEPRGEWDAGPGPD